MPRLLFLLAIAAAGVGLSIQAAANARMGGLLAAVTFSGLVRARGGGQGRERPLVGVDRRAAGRHLHHPHGDRRAPGRRGAHLRRRDRRSAHRLGAPGQHRVARRTENASERDPNPRRPPAVRRGAARPAGLTAGPRLLVVAPRRWPPPARAPGRPGATPTLRRRPSATHRGRWARRRTRSAASRPAPPRPGRPTGRARGEPRDRPTGTR